MNTRPPRAAYLHVPFCAHRCGYCNFAVVAGRDDLARPLIVALGTELSRLGQPWPVETAYIGGGTPTQLSPELLQRLCENLHRWHPIDRQTEWTVEANPADVNQEKVDILAAAGVTRISLGAQSFHPQKLTQLERDHQAPAIAAAVDLIRTAGMQVALDLMFAAPGETLADWQDDLAAAIALEPDHLSTYGLTYEHGTQFWNRRRRGELVEADDQLQRAMYITAMDTLGAAGWEHYEISNFAQPGKRSRHNETYWAGREYFAAGPGAARYVGGVRETNHRSTTTYLKRIERGESPVADREQLAPEARARELLVLGLRRLEGVDRAAFLTATGFDLDQLCGDRLATFVEQGLLIDDRQRVRLTRDGLLVSDALWPELV